MPQHLVDMMRHDHDIRERARRRSRLGGYTCCGVVCYVMVGLTFSDMGPTTLLAPDPRAACPAPAVETPEKGGSLTILQGNLWMLPVRPLLVPFEFATDRPARLERLVEAVAQCRPAIVLLQEVFERSAVELLARHLPDYRVLTSGATDFTGTVNSSGLVTLTKVPVDATRFQPFAPLPFGHTAYEVMARKGILATRVVSEEFEVTVLNVHLYGSRHPAEASVRRAEQLREVLDLVESLEASGQRVLIGGDFNIAREELQTKLPAGWAVSQHGPTYDPRLYPYTAQGANDTPANRQRRVIGAGARAIDFLLSPPSAGVHLVSQVLDGLLVSDHQFIHHTVWADAL
jgi:endonuclease/exonuclease/phosphatase family metal-dependent hydrolase